MPYIKIQLSEVSTEDYQLLLSEVADTPFNGIEEIGEKAYAIYFDEKDWKEDYEVMLTKYASKIQNEFIVDQNWNATWESQFDPVLIDDFCYVKAPFHPENNTVKHVIYLSPKMSFGTGHHATTKQMMEQMRDINFGRKRVFDFGTGTGILAVLAEKLGADYILGNDIDTWSIENAQETVSNNDCRNIDISLIDITEIEDSFDIILANINRHILIQYMPKIFELLKDNGILLLSGIFEADIDMVSAATKACGLEFVSSTVENNWACVRYQK